MKRAAVDIGTNSTRLYIADVGRDIKRIEKITKVTRLGQGVDKNKRLSSEAMNRNIDVLKEFREIVSSHGIEGIKAIATSAVRDALNRDEFLKRVKAETGIDIRLISGEEEAELGFLGASSVLYGEYGILVDIGGGSTEFISGITGKIDVSNSVDIGAVRITEKFLTPDIIEDNMLIKAENYIKDHIEGIVSKLVKVKNFTLIGIGGTVTTLAAVDQELKLYDIDKVHGYRLTKDRVNFIFQRFKSIGLNERKNIFGVQPERADIITAGTLILKIIMDKLKCDYIVVSERDNLDGIMLKEYGCNF